MGNESVEESGEISMPILAKLQQNGASSATMELVFCSLVAVSGSCVFGSALGYSSPTQSGIMADLSLSVAQFSVFGSILTIGAMVGSTMNGKIADYIGRKGTMGFSELFCIIGWLTIAFSKVYWWLCIGRLLLGYGMGVLSFVVPVYIAEITPKNLRGGFSALHALMTAFGIFVMFVVGSFVSWRVLALIGTIPCLIQLVGLFFIPESPRWLAKNGRWEECEAALQHFRGKKADIFDEAAEIKDFTESLKRHSEASIFELFQWKYAHSLVVGVGLMVLQQFGGVNGVGFYATSIFESAGFPGNVGTIAFVVVQLSMTAVGVVLMDKSGRKPLLMISAAGMSLGCLLAALSFLLHDFHVWPNFSPFLALVGVLTYKGSFSIGMSPIPWLILSEVFPMNVKGSAGSLATLVSWFCSWIVSYSFNFLMNWSSAGTFVLYSIMNGFIVLFVAILVPEMKGRTLEDIHKSIAKL